MTATETVTSAVAKRENGPSAMINQYRTDFTTVLPSHINGATWVRLAQGVLRRDRNLARIANQNPASLMQALMECARLGHEPGTESFYLVPMGGEIEGWEGYRGVIERMYRAGAVSNVKCEIVCANDTFRWSPTTMTRPDHEVDWFGDRGPAIGAYSYAEMRDGTTSKVVVINRKYIDKVRAMSKGSDKPTSPWQKWEDAMILKTAIHRLEPFVPTSAEYMREQLRALRDVQAEPVGTTTLPTRQEPAEDARVIDHQPHPPAAIDADPEADVVTGEIVDGEVMPDEPGEYDPWNMGAPS